MLQPPMPEAGCTMDSLDFTEEEIQQQLEILGYKNIPKHKLREFKQDLDDLIQRGEWKSLSSSNQVNSKTAISRLSPPAYTKEKLSRRCFRNGDGFFLHAQNGGHDTRVPTTCQNGDYERQGGCRDSYAQHSVASRQQLAPGAPNMLLVEPDPEDTTLHPPQTDSFMSTPDSQRRHFIRRKVLRKHNGESLVCDESIYSEDSDAASLEERLADLHLSPSAHHDSETENEDVTSHSDARSSEAEGMSLTAFESYIRTMTRTRSDGDIRPKPKSFIRPVLSQPTIKKADPVAKYFQYKQLWDMFKLPGEKDRRDLRWEIRERLAYQPPPPKPRRVFVPNTYTVPTEKKRSALRWEIRNDLANGLLPHKYSYRF